MSSPKAEQASRRRPFVMRSQARRAFTLIEIVVTLAIIALMAAVAAPALMNLATPDASDGLAPLRTLLMSAKRRSELDASDVEVYVVPATGRYRVEERLAGKEPVIDEGTIALKNARARGPADRFHILFRATGIGIGDTLAVGQQVLRVDPVLGTVEIGH